MNNPLPEIEPLMCNTEDSIPSLYVKSAPRTFDIRNIFQMARYQAPCLLIFEDIDTIVTPSSRSYFFNEGDVNTPITPRCSKPLS